jgi:hypothetical protein
VTEPGGELLASKSGVEEITEPVEVTTASVGLEITKNATLTEELFPAGVTGEASAESIQTTVASPVTGGEVTESPEMEKSTIASVFDNGATTEIVHGGQATTLSPAEESTQAVESSTPAKGRLI